MKKNTFCCECGGPCKAPRGNWNARRVALCQKITCRRKRKTALQKERRKQGELFRVASAGAPSGLRPKRVAGDSPVKAKARAAFGRGLRQAWKAGVNVAG
jgi:hypothetical protein